MLSELGPYEIRSSSSTNSSNLMARFFLSKGRGKSAPRIIENTIRYYPENRRYRSRMGASTLTSNTEGLLRKGSRTVRVEISSVTKFSRQWRVMCSSSRAGLEKARLSSVSFLEPDSNDVFVKLDVIDRNEAGVLRTTSESIISWGIVICCPSSVSVSDE